MVIESTLDDLRIRNDRDKFNLAKDKLSLAKVDHPESGETFYLGLVHHPLSGTHFSQVLNTVAPYRSNVQAIIFDFNQAKLAHRKALEGDKSGSYLDRVHREDPDVRAAYIEFFDNHLSRWKRALRNRQFDPLFDTLESLRFTYSIDVLIDQFAAQRRLEVAEGLAGQSEPGAFNLMSIVLGTKPKDFVDYLRTKPDFSRGLREPMDLDDEGVLDRFNRLGNWDNRLYNFIYGYVQELSEEELRQLALKHIVDSRHTVLVDLGRKQAMIPSSRPTELSFIDRERVWVRDSGCGVLLRSSMDERGNFDWRVLDYELVEATGYYVLPLWAWGKNNQGERRFLTQPEALKALTRAGLGRYHYLADVMVGRVVSTAFMLQLTFDWEGRISLTTSKDKKTRKNNISGAQVGSWVSMSDHANQLLKFHYYRELEEVADKAT